MLNKRHSHLKILASASLLGLLLSGCSGSEAADENEGGQPVSVGLATDGGQNYDPLSAGNQFVSMYLLPVYDSLLSIDADGNIGAKLAELTDTSDDGLTLTLELREDVTFHDGEHFNADAVVANLDRYQNGEGSVLAGDLSSIEEVVKVSDYQVELHLTEPDAALPALLADKAGMMISPAALENSDLDIQPVGAGPYKVTEHMPGDSVTFEKFEEYWDYQAETASRLDVDVVLDSEARLRAGTSDELDIVQIGMDQISAAEDGGLSVSLSGSLTAPLILYLNMQEDSPLHDPLVREAVALAIDRDGINEGIAGGACTPQAQLFKDEHWAASPNLTEQADLERDIERAQELMAEAGYEDGFEMSLAAIAPAPYRLYAEALGDQLAAINISTDLRIGEPVQVVGDFNQQKVTDAYVSLWPGSADPSKTYDTLYDPEGLFNPGAYEDAEVLRLMDEGASTSDMEARAEIYHELNEIAFAEKLHIPICGSDSPSATGAGVTGFTTSPTGASDIRNLIKE